ncbi:unnamed protein product [Adineta ricciae]|uniref:Uncharacterized protein n=1 Tax=Adineta ricciae TaxID=249248 RepID=A0A815SJ47_ADIRI|nr:unnamed protein product [Adineta ricciae]
MDHKHNTRTEFTKIIAYEQAQQKNDEKDFVSLSGTVVSPSMINTRSIPFFLTKRKTVDMECESMSRNSKESHHRYSCVVLLIFLLVTVPGTYAYKTTGKVNRKPLRNAFINANTVWSETGTFVAGGNNAGALLNQLSYPYGLYVDSNQTIYVADEQNHRIVAWDHGATEGRVVAGGNGAGNRLNQLDKPSDVIVDERTNSIIICDYGNQRVVRWNLHNRTAGQVLLSNGGYFGLTMDNLGYLYVTDRSRNNVQRWRMGDKYMTVVAGGNGKGDRLDQFDQPRYISVDQDYSIYVSDWNNDRVMKWMADADEGVIVAGGQGKGNSSKQLSYPEDVVVDQRGTVYVVDQWNNRVMRWPKGETHGNLVIGGENMKDQSKQIYRPVGLAFDRYGNLYVVEHGNHRVQKFSIKLINYSK